jgi:hypothetical protein
MDEGPFRVSRPADRRAVNRPEPAYRQPQAEGPQHQAKPEPTPVERPAASKRTSSDDKSSRRFKFPLLLVILAIILGVVGWMVFSNMNKGGTAIDTGKYQAVFFTNGQVYFGKLSVLNDEYMKLNDIYYLQTQSADAEETNPQQTSSDDSNVQLIKLGDEIHGPEDEMILSKEQVLFYENLKTDGKVANSIQEYQKTNN